MATKKPKLFDMATMPKRPARKGGKEMLMKAPRVVKTAVRARARKR